jgi:hypothetical protein
MGSFFLQPTSGIPQEPSFRPKSLALLRAAQRRNPLLHLDSRSTTAPTCRCPLLLSFSFANHKKPFVILTLSKVEWGRTPTFVFAFVFVVACSFSQTRGIVISTGAAHSLICERRSGEIRFSTGSRACHSLHFLLLHLFFPVFCPKIACQAPKTI